MINLESTKVIIELCKLYNIKRFLFASTCSVYGYTEGIKCNEGSITEPVSLYAKTKLDSEHLILKAMDNKFNPVILRLATLYGKSRRMRFDLVLNVLTAKAETEGKIKIFGGEQWRPLLHVRDAARAFAVALESPLSKIRGQIFNVGSNEQNYKVKELANHIKKHFPGIKIEFMEKEDDERSYCVLFDKIEHVLKNKTEKNANDGIVEMQELIKSSSINDYKEPIYYNINYRYLK